MMLCVATVMLLAQPLGGCVAAEHDAALARDDQHALASRAADELAAPDDLAEVAAEEVTSALCCIDWYCPGTDIEFSACGGGNTAARYSCEKACDVSCKSSGYYCE